MRTLVTGAAGYLGSALVRAVGDRVVAPPDARWLLTDRVLPGAAFDAADASGRHVSSDRDDRDGVAADVVRIAGDIGDPSLLERLFETPIDTVFHLAGIVSGAAEADYEAGKRTNLDATIALLERCRLQAARGGPVVRFVYASSIAVFGTPLPHRIDDATAPAPTLSYGTHKRACELLIDDCTRRGFIDGRALRLSGVVVRPPLANGALSGFNSDLIREPLAGRTYTCPVGAGATIWIATLADAVGNLARLGHVDGAAIGPQRATTMPSLAVSVADVVAAIARVDAAAAARIAFAPQPAIEAQFGRWPLDCAFDKGRALGLSCVASIDDVIRTHLESR
jgi:nucleoside-diphosphate-sugar epimerase